MARESKKSDISYNARRREYRAAQRYLKKAAQTSGATSDRNRAIARTHLENALATYDASQKQNISAPIKNLAAEFGISIGEIRTKYADITESKKSRIVEESMQSLEKVSDDLKRESEAKALINNPSIAKRVLGGLVDVWRDKIKKGMSNTKKRQVITDAIFDFFQVTSWADVFDKLSKNIGDILFSSDADYEIYDYVRIVLQKHIASGTIAQ